MPPTGTKGPPAWAPRTGHVEAHLSRFWIEPGLKGQGISTDPLVPVPEPGQKALMNRDNRPFFYQCNDMPLSTLIDNNNESMDVNFVGRNNFGNNTYRGNFNPRPLPSNPSNNYGNSYNNSYANFNNMSYDFEISVKEFMSSQKNFNALIEFFSQDR